MAKTSSESFYFTSSADIRRLAAAFRDGIEQGQGLTQKLKGGVTFERPSGGGDDPYDDLFAGADPDFHVVAVIPTGRAQAAVPVTVHLKLWNAAEGHVTGEVEGRYGGTMMSSEGRGRCRDYMAKAIDGLRSADNRLKETS